MPKLLDLLRDEDQLVSVEAAQALRRIQPDALRSEISVLITELTQGEPATRVAAVKVLGNIGPGADAAVPALREIILCTLDADDGAFEKAWRLSPDQTRGSIESHALEAIFAIEWPLSHTLVEIATDPNSKETYSRFLFAHVWTIQMRRGLGLHRGKAAFNGLPPWHFHQRVAWSPEIHDGGDIDENRRHVVLLPPRSRSVSELLVLAGNTTSKESNRLADEAVVRLNQILTNHRNEHARAMAAEMLGEFGLRSTPAVPALRAALGNQNEMVRKAAAAAFERIESRSHSVAGAKTK